MLPGNSATRQLCRSGHGGPAGEPGGALGRGGGACMCRGLWKPVTLPSLPLAAQGLSEAPGFDPPAAEQ